MKVLGMHAHTLVDDVFQPLVGEASSPPDDFGAIARLRRRQLETVAESATYVWLRRRDKSEQAVSWWVAGRTGLWMQKLSYDSRVLDDLDYDFDAIDTLRRDSVADEAEWQGFFDANSIDPLTIFYEDVVADPAESLGDLAVNLGGSFTPVIETPVLRNHIQSNDATRAVHDRYVRELATRVQ